MKKIFEHVREDVGGKMLCNGLVAWKPTENSTTSTRCTDGDQLNTLIQLLIEAGYKQGKVIEG